MLHRPIPPLHDHLLTTSRHAQTCSLHTHSTPNARNFPLTRRNDFEPANSRCSRPVFGQRALHLARLALRLRTIPAMREGSPVTSRNDSSPRMLAPARTRPSCPSLRSAISSRILSRPTPTNVDSDMHARVGVHRCLNAFDRVAGSFTGVPERSGTEPPFMGSGDYRHRHPA